MTILLITETLPPKIGGSGRFLWEIYRRLPRSSVVIAAGEDRRAAEFDQSHAVPVVRLPLTLPGWGLCSFRELRGYWRALRPINRLIRSAGITQVHCGRCLPEGWIALLLKKWRRLPYISFVHGEEVNLDGAGPGVMNSRQLRWMTRHVLWGAEFLIANSRNTARILREGWHLPEERIRVLYPGVDTEHYVPAAPDREFRARRGWGDRPVVLTVSRLQKRKGHDQLIRALGIIRQTVPDVLYMIVGDGEERAALEALVAHEGHGEHVQFLGELDEAEVLRCYQQCDLFVLPNRQVGQDVEGFGMVLLEAQACGKPVVAGASGGTAETMSIPETGQVVPCDGPEHLAPLVAELLRDPERRTRMGTAARRWVVAHFDWSVLSRQAQQLLPCEPGPRPAPRSLERQPS